MKQLALAIFGVVIPAHAFAYFDPGTGSLIIQALIGGLAAVTLFWGRVKLFVTSWFQSKVDADVESRPDANALHNEDSNRDA